LLLRILELEKTKFAFNRIAAGIDDNKDVKELCYKQFKIKIVSTGINEFIDELYKRCSASSEVKLRQLDTSEKVAQSIESVQDQKLGVIKERLNRLYKLLSEYELELDLCNDPTDKMRFGVKIENIREKIAEAETELKNL